MGRCQSPVRHPTPNISTAFLYRFDLHVSYEAKTLAGGDQKMDLPEERVDVTGGFEYAKIFSLFQVISFDSGAFAACFCR
jgi:hypothetical protein